MRRFHYLCGVYDRKIFDHYTLSVCSTVVSRDCKLWLTCLVVWAAQLQEMALRDKLCRLCLIKYLDLRFRHTLIVPLLLPMYANSEVHMGLVAKSINIRQKFFPLYHRRRLFRLENNLFSNEKILKKFYWPRVAKK